MNYIVRDPTYSTLALGALLVMAIGFFAEPLQEPSSSRRFFLEKIGWSDCADVVLAGDSRVYQGLSPQLMGGNDSNLRIANFGFSACGYSEEYLQGIEQVLAEKALQPTVVLGVTPRSLTVHACTNNGYLDHLRQYSKFELLKHRRLERMIDFFRPLSIRRVRAVLAGRSLPSAERLRVEHPGGWLECDIPDAMEIGTIREYRVHFIQWPVDEAIVARLLRQVREWSGCGITVFGFRPPISSPLLEVENEMSGFDEEAFRAAFSSAGGIWLPVYPDGYVTYDGSHLDPESARRLSLYLADAMKQSSVRVTSRDDVPSPVR